jgi:hypothetical protein
MERSQTVLELRPILNLKATENQSDIERFQNDTIRPIIKFQHEVILALVFNHKFYEKSVNRAALKSFLNGQKELRHQLIGLVIGLFDLSEFEAYQLNAPEYQRRIIQIVSQRVFDTIGTK